MPRNLEIKARIDDRRGVLERSEALSGEPGYLIRQRDVYFRVSRGRLKLRSVEGQAHELIFYERADGAGPELSSYRRTPVAGGAEMEEILAAALGVGATVDKERLLFRAGQTRIHVDRVRGLGDFLELEVVLAEGDSLQGGERRAGELMERLGVSRADLVEVSYADLLQGSGEAPGGH